IMSRLMLERSAKVIIWDINPKGIEETISEFTHLGVIAGYTVDVSDLEQIQETAKKVKEDFGSIDVLINNAGIIVGEYFHDHTNNDVNHTMDINATDSMLITADFLQDTMDRNSGHICNRASSGEIISNPKMSVYAASKWSLIGWSDSLRLEMEQLNKKVK